MTRKTETIKVKKLDGTEQEVLIYENLNIIEQTQVYEQIMEEKRETDKHGNTKSVWEPNMLKLVSTLVPVVWADKNTSYEEIDANSLRDQIMQRYARFLYGSDESTDN